VQLYSAWPVPQIDLHRPPDGGGGQCLRHGLWQCWRFSSCHCTAFGPTAAISTGPILALSREQAPSNDCEQMAPPSFGTLTRRD